MSGSNPELPLTMLLVRSICPDPLTRQMPPPTELVVVLAVMVELTMLSELLKLVRAMPPPPTAAVLFAIVLETIVGLPPQKESPPPVPAEAVLLTMAEPRM